MTLTVKLHGGGNRLTLSVSNNTPIDIHPLWLRERVINDGANDPVAFQRLYEHAEFEQDMRALSVATLGQTLRVQFSDGYDGEFSIAALETELGWRNNVETPPLPVSWDASLSEIPQGEWEALDHPENMTNLLKTYFRHGFCIINGTPTKRDSLKTLARRFGYLRETNFGEIFNVEMKPDASDLAYTDVALASHTDNPYRDPVPGIQFLHCLRNEVAGGLSTLVDGMAIAERLRAEAPEQAQALEDIDVRFRYVGPTGILEHHGPIIERDHRGLIRHIRLSSRVDYVPAIDPDLLSLFYAGRRRLYELSNDPAYKISFPFKPGLLLMMDNYRLLHGRTAFNGKQGHRHLQGGYIDHDGPDMLYRSIQQGYGKTHVMRET